MARPRAGLIPGVGDAVIGGTKVAPTWNEEIARRQRVLRAKGFSVPMSGSWDARTRLAWEQSQSGARPAGPPAPSLVPKLEAVKTPVIKRDENGKVVVQKQISPQQAIANARAHSVIAKLPASKKPAVAKLTPQQIEKIAKQDAIKVFTGAYQKRDAPEKWTSSEMVALFADPLTRVPNWERDSQWVRRIQRWVNANGEKVTPDGSWGPITYEAVTRVMIRERKKEEEQRNKALIKIFYTPFGIKPGDTGFPMLGTAPTPDELAALLRQGGFGATMIQRAAATQLKQNTDGWLLYRDHNLDLLLRGGTKTGIDGALGLFAPNEQFSGKLTLLEKAELIADILRRRNLTGRDDKRGDTLGEEVLALARATSPEDFARRAKLIADRDDEAYIRWQAEEAKARDFWGDALVPVGNQLEKLSVPANAVQDYLAQSYGFAKGSMEGFGNFVESILAGGDPEVALKNVAVHQREEVAKAVASWNAWEKAHPWLDLVLELVVDPLNFIPVAGAGKALGVGAARAAAIGARTGRSVIETSEIAGRTVPKVVARAAGAPLIAPEALGKKAIGSLHAAKDIAAETAVGRAVKAQTTTVIQRVSDTNEFVHAGVAFGFRAANELDQPAVRRIIDENREILKGVEADVRPFEGGPRTGEKLNILDALDGSRARVTELLDGNFDGLVDTLAKARVSIYANQARGTLKTDVGDAFAAAVSSHLYTIHSEDFAFSHWRDAYAKAVADGAAPSAARAAADAEFREVFDAVGTYFGGGRYEVMKQIEGRVLNDQNSLYSGFLPALQDAVEARIALIDQAAAVKAGADGTPLEVPAPLFDADGVFSGLNGPLGQDLRQIISSTWDEIEAGKVTLDEALQNPEVAAWFNAERSKILKARNDYVSRLRRQHGEDSAVFKERVALKEKQTNSKLARLEEQAIERAKAALDPSDPRSIVTIKNADVGRVFDSAAKDDYVSMFVSRRARSLSQYAARAASRGKPLAPGRLEQILEDYRLTVNSWFEPDTRGRFKMTNESISVPAVYARHIGDSYSDALRGAHPILHAEDVPESYKSLLGMAATPAEIRSDPMSIHLDRVARSVSSTSLARVSRTAADRAAVSARNPSEVAETELNLIHDQILRARKQEAVSPEWVMDYTKHLGLLQIAASHVYPRKFAKDGAYWLAMAHAQSEPLRRIYNGFDAYTTLFVSAVIPWRPGSVFRNLFDSVTKNLTRGVIDPRWYFFRSMTAGERAARKSTSEVAAAMFPRATAAKRAVQDAIPELPPRKPLTPEMERAGWTKEMPESVFEVGVNEMTHLIGVTAGKHGAVAATGFRRIVNSFWSHDSETIRNVFRMHGVREVPDEVVMGAQALGDFTNPVKTISRVRITDDAWRALDGMDGDDAMAWIRDFTRQSVDGSRVASNVGLRHPLGVFFAAFRDLSWDLMVARVEGNVRRALFNSTYAREIRKGSQPFQATVKAVKAVDDTLFDYSKVTTLENNLRVLAPFIFFWRRNIQFWTSTMIQKPWVPAAIEKWTDTMEDVNGEYPPWARRYLRLPWLTDAIAKVPILNKLFPNFDDFNVGYDPLNYGSFANLYRTYKGDSQLLPEDEDGLPFIADLVDAIGATGLTFTPFFRKPLELAGVLNYRAWQQMFPQTALVDIFSREFLDELFPNGLNLEEVFADQLFKAMGQGPRASQISEARINELVQLEMAAQQQRGEPINRAAALDKVRKFNYLQTIYGFFAGAFLRNLDPAQIRLYQIQEALAAGELEFSDLSEEEQKAYQIFKRRKWNSGAFNQYLNVAPQIEAYYALDDYDESQTYKMEHPEIVPYVSKVFRGTTLMGDDWKRTAVLQSDTEAWASVAKVLDTPKLDYGTKKAIRDVFITPDLKTYWGKNDTPADTQDAMIRGEVFGYIKRLQDQYFSIPRSDKDARRGFLEQNPLLGHSFSMNNTDSDDLKDVLNAANSDLREIYFDFVQGKDWDNAGDFLKQFPFIFDFTSASNRVQDGIFLPDEIGTPRADDFIRAHPHLKTFFEILNTRGKDAAYEWLRSAGEAGAIVQDYFDKYAKKTEKGQAYKKARPHIDRYAKIKAEQGSEAARDWLNGPSDGARIVRDFFERFPSDSPAAKAFQKAEPWIEHYGKLKEQKGSEAAREWLNGSSEGARIAREFFAKYAKETPASRLYKAAEPFFATYDALKQKDPNAAREWLNGDSAGAKAMRAFFDKTGDPKKREEFKRAEPWLNHFTKLKKQDKQAAYDWLNGKSEGAAIARAFFAKYATGSKTEHAKAYLAVKSELTWFFDKLADEGRFRGYYSKWRWMYDSDDPAAVKIRAYLNKWGSKDGASAQAQAYVAARKDLDTYFALAEKDKGAASDWLNSGTPEADRVLDYFKRFGKTNRMAKKWGAWVRSQNPEVNERLRFWSTYFSLDPSQRAGFIHSQGEKHGIYVWGPTGQQQEEDDRADYLRKAKKRHLTPKAALYLRVKPLVDLFQTLDDKEQQILLKANPDLQHYFTKYASGPDTGSAELDKKVEAYFSFEPDSDERSAFLKANPDVQDYFDEKDPASAPMRRLLEVYFNIPVGRERRSFRDLHPEIGDYFDRKREERSLLRAELEVFDHADPRLSDYWERAEEQSDEADAMFATLRARIASNLAGDDLELSRSRRQPKRRTQAL